MWSWLYSEVRGVGVGRRAKSSVRLQFADPLWRIAEPIAEHLICVLAGEGDVVIFGHRVARKADGGACDFDLALNGMLDLDEVAAVRQLWIVGDVFDGGDAGNGQLFGQQQAFHFF